MEVKTVFFFDGKVVKTILLLYILIFILHHKPDVPKKMEIDNLPQVKRFHLITGLFLLTLALFGYYWREIHELLGRPTFAMRVGFSATTLFSMGIILLMKPAYFYCQITERKIVIKFYKIFWYEAMKILEISKNDFRKYEVLTYNYGLTKELQISIMKQSQIIDSSKISLSLVKKADIQKLMSSLENLKK